MEEPLLAAGRWLWLRSSSQEPMVAARLASLPLLPTAVSDEEEEVVVGVWAEVGGASACLVSRDAGVKSGGSSAGSAGGDPQVWTVSVGG